MSTPLILPLCPKPLRKSILHLLNPSTTINSRRRGSRIKCQATGQPPQPTAVYQGAYGPWKIESADVQEVILYRFGLVTAASCFVAVSSTAFLDWEALDLIRRNLDLFFGVGACGLGLSLYLIHIYVSEIKRTLQALWLIGAVGSLGAYAALARPAGKCLVDYVVENPSAVWFVGPLFAALTGLVFKEGALFLFAKIKSCVV